MNILKKLLFSFSGKIGRADYIYGIVYALLLFFVSVDAFIHPAQVHLIGGGIDTVQILVFLISAIGLVLFVWMFFAVTIKRARALGFNIWWTVAAFFVSPLLVVGLMKDVEPYQYHGGLSLVDQIFFHTLSVIVLLCVFVLYDVTQAYSFVIVLVVILGILATYLFWSDRLPYRSSPKNKYSGLDTWLDLGFVLVIVFFVRLFIMSPFQIIGPSMEATFHGGAIKYIGQEQKYSDGEFILVDKMTYRLSEPKRGDVVVFTPGIGPEKRYLIKRVIGMPGDVVKVENGYVWVALAKNPTLFIKLDESKYLLNNFGRTCLNYAGFNCNKETETFTVPQDRYFLLGDNRPQSLDARKCFSNSGCTGDFGEAQYVPLSRIQGRVAYSLGHFDLLSQIFPYPKLGTFKQIVDWRGLDILNQHTYTELEPKSN